MRASSLLGALLIALNTSVGCTLVPVAPEPGKITFRQAMQEVAVGLNDLYHLREGQAKTGLIPQEVTIVFNISASAKNEGKLYVEAGATAADVLKITKVGAEGSSSIDTSRGNQITIKLNNILFAGKETLIITKTPQEVEQLMNLIEGAGYSVYVNPKIPGM